MLNELKKLKEELIELKQIELEKLKKFNSNLKINSLVRKYKYFIPNEKNFSKIKIAFFSRGFSINSELSSEKHEYIYLGDTNDISEILNYLKEIKNPFVEISFNGSQIGKIETELHFIIEDKLEQKKAYKLKLGQTKMILLNENIVNFSLAIRVKGNGKLLIDNPLLIVGEQQSVNINVEPKEIKDLEVIFIADEFTTKCFQEEFNIIPISPEKWEDELKNKNPDLFFCESAWLGNDKKWKDMVGSGGPRDNTILLEVVKWCRVRNIPTVFWNKEDPFHYDAFIETAKHFDFVFTTDESSIQRYKKDGCENVFTLPFAAQPKLHNPIEKYERKNKVVFAGAYYGDKFPERKKAMDNMIEISGQYGLEIFDRNLYNPESPNQFPDKFKKYIVGTLPQEQIDKAYKGYKVSLNVNSIIDSPTMFSRRVFEILASNTPVVSSQSLGMSNFFGDILTVSSDFDVLKKGISKYFEDEQFYKKNRLYALRRVFENHTYHHRVKEILTRIKFPFIDEEPYVSYIGIVRSKDDYENLIQTFENQNLKNKKLVILLDIFDGYLEIFNSNNNETISTFLLDYIHHYSDLSKMIKNNYIIPLSKDNLYGPNYGRDLFIATKYTNDSIIVKGHEQEYIYVTGGRIDQSLIPLKVLTFLSPNDFVEKLEKNKYMDEWFKFGVSFFNIDNFNVISNYQDTDNFEQEKNNKFI